MKIRLKDHPAWPLFRKLRRLVRRDLERIGVETRDEAVFDQRMGEVLPAYLKQIRYLYAEDLANKTLMRASRGTEAHG